MRNGYTKGLVSYGGNRRIFRPQGDPLEDSDAAKQRSSPGLCRDKAEARRQNHLSLHDDTACYWLFSAWLLRGAEKDWAHHGFNPGCHLFRGDAIGSLEPAARGSKNGPRSGGRWK